MFSPNFWCAPLRGPPSSDSHRSRSSGRQMGLLMWKEGTFLEEERGVVGVPASPTAGFQGEGVAGMPPYRACGSRVRVTKSERLMLPTMSGTCDQKRDPSGGRVWP
eukprot:5121223-Pyramimonas_sp.AAC.1